MKRYAKPMTELPKASLASEADITFDIEKLLDRGGLILARDLSNIMAEGSRGKLSATSARDLVSYIRLLSEIKESIEAELDSLTDEELRARVQKEA